MNILQRRFHSTGKSKSKRSHVIAMEHYSCSKMMQPNTATKEREKSQPMRLKELFKCSEITKSAKKGPVREKSKPERLTIAISGIKNVESTLTKEGSHYKTNGADFDTTLRERNVRRKLNLNFGTPKTLVNGNRSMYVAKKTDTKEVQRCNAIIQNETENYQTNKIVSAKSKNSFLMPPNTIRNMYLRKQTQVKEERPVTAKSDQSLALNCQQRCSTIHEERGNSKNAQNLANRLVPDQTTTFEEDQKTETINGNIEDSEVLENITSRQANETHSECKILQLHSLPAITNSDGDVDFNISGIHCTQKSYSQLTNLNLPLYMNSLPIMSQQGSDQSGKAVVQDTINTTCTDNADMANVKSNLRNIIRATEGSLAQLKSILSHVEGMSLRQENKSADVILPGVRDDGVINTNLPTSVLTEACIVKVDKEVQVQMQSSGDHNDNVEDGFEIIYEENLIEQALNESGETTCNKNLALPETVENHDSNKENYQHPDTVQMLDDTVKFNVSIGNLTLPPCNDSFLTLENELNILHIRQNVDRNSNAKHSKANVTKQEIDCKENFDESVREYMLLKSDLNCLETPNVKKFRLLSYRDTDSVPLSMNKMYTSSKVLAELQNLYTESPDF